MTATSATSAVTPARTTTVAHTVGAGPTPGAGQPANPADPGHGAGEWTDLGESRAEAAVLGALLATTPAGVAAPLAVLTVRTSPSPPIATCWPQSGCWPGGGSRWTR